MANREKGCDREGTAVVSCDGGEGNRGKQHKATLGEGDVEGWREKGREEGRG